MGRELRGWMVQIAGNESTFSWLGTFALILLPGIVVGALLGWAEYLRRTRALWGRRQRWLVASPLLLASALLDPKIFQALITSGTGGGALGVVIIGLPGGYALSHRGRLWSRMVSGLFGLGLHRQRCGNRCGRGASDHRWWCVGGRTDRVTVGRSLPGLLHSAPNAAVC
jgi:hypothetical protein